MPSFYGEAEWRKNGEWRMANGEWRKLGNKKPPFGGLHDTAYH